MSCLPAITHTFLRPFWLFLWSVWHFQDGAPIKSLFPLQCLSLSGVPAVEITPYPSIPHAWDMFNFNCLSFYPSAIFPLISFFLFPFFSHLDVLCSSFADEHLYCRWRLLEWEMCQKSWHGSKRMSQAFSVIKPTVAKCTGRQWWFVDDHFLYTSLELPPVFV